MNAREMRLIYLTAAYHKAKQSFGFDSYIYAITVHAKAGHNYLVVAKPLDQVCREVFDESMQKLTDEGYSVSDEGPREARIGW